jgi:hypothetical protein
MAQQPLPLPNIPWVNKDGTPSDAFFRFMTASFPSGGIDHVARSLRLTPVTFAQRPTPSQEGMLSLFTDSKSAVAGTVLTAGGGTVHAVVVFLKGGWTVIVGK